MRPPRNALASTGSTAGGAFLRASQRSIAAEQKAAQHRRAKGGERRHALGGAEANVEGNAEDPHMRGVDEGGHHGDAQAGQDADADRKRRHAEFARAQSRARSRQRDQRRTWPETNRARRRTREPMFRTYARAVRLCQGRRARRPPLSGSKAPCRRDGSFRRVRPCRGYGRCRANCGRGCARRGARHRR